MPQGLLFALNPALQLQNHYGRSSCSLPRSGIMSKTEENLKHALAGESEARAKYTNWAGAASKEGNEPAARFFENVIRIEKHHGKRFKLLLDRLKSGALYKSDKEEFWF